MFLRQLEYLTALAREQHFGRAAAACHVSQPALSVAIRRLEQELGLELVRRDARSGELTDEGRDLLRWADLTLAGVEGLKSEAARLTSELRGRLRLGAIPTSLPALGGIVEPLLSDHRGVEVEVRSMSSREIGLQLKTHGIDAGITYLDNEPLGNVRTVPIYEERYVFLTPEETESETIAWSALDGVRLCLLSGDMQNRRIVDSLLESAGAKVEVRLETNSITALFSFVCAGWPCIVSRAWLDLYGIPPGMSARAIVDPAAGHRIGLVLPATDLISPTVRALLGSISPGSRTQPSEG